MLNKKWRMYLNYNTASFRCCTLFNLSFPQECNNGRQTFDNLLLEVGMLLGTVYTIVLKRLYVFNNLKPNKNFIEVAHIELHMVVSFCAFVQNRVVCDLCEMTFRQKCNRATHMSKVHHDFRYQRFRCCLCAHRFSAQIYLDKHVVKHHGPQAKK